VPPIVTRLSEVAIVGFIDREDRGSVRRRRAWFTAVHAAQEKLMG
jgi:hypothetical protein